MKDMYTFKSYEKHLFTAEPEQSGHYELIAYRYWIVQDGYIFFNRAFSGLCNHNKQILVDYLEKTESDYLDKDRCEIKLIPRVWIAR